MAHLMIVPRIGTEHFERWLTLWQQTAAELFPEHAAAKFVDKPRPWRSGCSRPSISIMAIWPARLADRTKRKIDGTGSGRLRIDN
jgi:hypothetical protein